ncbi:hypothetical protein GCM10027346_32350 [Hymenobacter seoulensis]
MPWKVDIRRRDVCLNEVISKNHLGLIAVESTISSHWTTRYFIRGHKTVSILRTDQASNAIEKALVKHKGALTTGQADSTRLIYRKDINSLQGIWAANTKGNAEFWVKGSHLTYVEYPDQHLLYTITPTTFTIFQEDGPYRCQLKKLTKDSLVYVTPGGFIARLYKRK